MKTLEPEAQGAITCDTSGTTCSWIFREAQQLDTSNMAAVRHFCWAGLSRSGIYAEMLHTQAFDRRLAHLSCFAGMAFVLSMCAVAESSCDSGSTRSVTPKSGKTSTHSEDPALSFFLMAFKALAMVSHCIDASDWPLTVAEFSANFQLFVEHGHCGFRWMQPRRGLPFISGVSGATLHDGVPSIHRGIQNHAEVHMRINWAMGAWDNRMYWEEKMRNSAQQLKELNHKHPEELCELLTTQKLGHPLVGVLPIDVHSISKSKVQVRNCLNYID